MKKHVRKIIKIDEEKCNGCGLCIPNCPEGALQIIDGKARLVSDLACDGLGACIGHCPQGAITIEERPAEDYDEVKVMENIVKQGSNVIAAHLKHLKDHNQENYLAQAIGFLEKNHIPVPDAIQAPRPHAHAPSGCPGARMMDFRGPQKTAQAPQARSAGPSELRQWPIQLLLVPPTAPYLSNAHLLIAADCVPFAYADFHNDLLKGKIVLVGCPKFDDVEYYKEKITQILKNNTIQSITYAHMEVPCCFGLVPVVRQAITDSGKQVPFNEAVIGIQGDRLQ